MYYEGAVVTLAKQALHVLNGPVVDHASFCQERVRDL